MTLDEAKERISVANLWREFGYPGEPRKSCRCPFHEDKTPSFSVFNNAQNWKCFSGCGEGDAIAFLAHAKNLSNGDACREFLRRAGPCVSQPPPPPPPLRRTYLLKSGHHEKFLKRVELPRAVAWRKDIAEWIADTRGLDVTAIEFSFLWLGTLSFGWACNQKCWLLSDASLRCAEARRNDAESFPASATLKERKSHALPGSSKSWPVGILPPKLEEKWLQEHLHRILLVEGGPDYLAACQLIAAQDENVLPVTMLGSSASISEDALRYFAGRDVTIVAHPDIDGRSASARWARQIAEAGGRARIFNLQQNDLCDVIASGATNDDLRLL